jgi:ABC-type branched-subunit amino acid transport system substrate-binding protein
MNVSRKLLILLFVLGLIAAACGGDDSSDDGPSDPSELTVDVGVDIEAGTIKIGMLSDLTGPFGPLVSAIVAAHEVYWGNVNANGGINGLQVELVVRDTVYDPVNHVQFYEELKDSVVAFGHSTGTPQTLAINEDLQSDGILAIPLTWYSGWTDPDINANLLPHGTPYCLEAMSMIEYLQGVAQENGIANPTLAVASVPGDFGLDAMAGALLAAEALGIEVISDGSGTIIPGQDQLPVSDAIVNSGADMVYVTASPGLFGEVYGGVVAQGFQALWSGAGPSYNPVFLDGAIADAISRDHYGSLYLSPWGSDNAGMQDLMDLLATASPDAPASDYYGEGVVEAKIMHEVLLAAYAAGDMTQAGVVKAAKSLESIEFNGLAPSESYAGDPNDIVQREITVFRPDKALRAAGGTGTVTIEETYTGSVAADYTFTGACYELS